jgi:tetratricopeptide (TPR) repeat protein
MTISLKQTRQEILGLLNNNRSSEALSKVNRLISEYSKEGLLYELKGHCLLALQKDHKQVLNAFLTGIKLTPNSANMAAYIGGIYHSKNNLDEAQRFFRKALSIDPSMGKAWHFLSLILFDKKQFNEGIECQQQANQNDPFKTELQSASEAFLLGQPQQGMNICRKILQHHTRHPKALILIAEYLIQQGQLEQARDALTQALSYSPFEFDALLTASQIEAQLRDYQQALLHSSKLTVTFADSIQALLIHADNQLNAGQYQEASKSYQNLTFRKSKNVDTHQNRENVDTHANLQNVDTHANLENVDTHANGILQQAHIAKILGHSVEAAGLYSRALKSMSTKGSAYWSLSGMHNYHFSKPQVNELEAMQLNPEIPADQACQAGFTLARHWELNKQYDAAFLAFQSANMNKQGGQFQPQQYAAKCSSLKSTFNQPILSIQANTSPPSCATPIFIVGLPRSGSTLVEQILASHSEIEGTMELKLLPAIARRVFLDSCTKNQDSSGDMSKFSTHELAEYGQWYLQKSQIFRTDRSYFIDKLPPNFQHIGLIKMILPHAIIIDARRQPLACGLGIYKQYFGHGHDFAYNFEHIGFYYNQYLSLMDHWDQVLPKTVLCVQHENLVLDTKKQIERMLDHCGLEFQQSCLEFDKNVRAVRTASSEQVRQPISQQGLDLWKNYSNHLNPLRKSLGERTLDKFSDWIELD